MYHRFPVKYVARLPLLIEVEPRFLHYWLYGRGTPANSGCGRCPRRSRQVAYCARQGIDVSHKNAPAAELSIVTEKDYAPVHPPYTHPSCQSRCTREPIWKWPPRKNTLQRTIFLSADEPTPG